MKRNPNQVCLIEECGKRFHARGLCDGHYKQWLRKQKIRPLRERDRNNSQPYLICDEEDCQETAYSKGLCKNHYEKQRRETKRGRELRLT